MYFVFNLRKIALSAAVVAVTLAVCAGGGEFVKVFKVGERELPIYSVEREDNRAAITFNCAWNDSDVDEIIEILKKNDVGATFFVVGEWAEKYPTALKKLSDAGFEIGSHSHKHGHSLKMSREEILDDMEKSFNAIEAVTGRRVRLYRAAYGEYGDDVVTACEQTGRICIQWLTDSLDYKAKSADEITERVVKKVSNGDIILMHSGTEHTAEALNTLIPALKEKYTLVSVSELIYDKDFTVDFAGRQHKVRN